MYTEFIRLTSDLACLHHAPGWALLKLYLLFLSETKVCFEVNRKGRKMTNRVAALIDGAGGPEASIRCVVSGLEYWLDPRYHVYPTAAMTKMQAAVQRDMWREHLRSGCSISRQRVSVKTCSIFLLDESARWNLPKEMQTFDEGGSGVGHLSLFYPLLEVPLCRGRSLQQFAVFLCRSLNALLVLQPCNKKRCSGTNVIKTTDD